MTTPTITVTVPLSREGLVSLRDHIDELLYGVADHAAASTTRSVEDNAEKKVEQVWIRVGDNTKRFLAHAAQLVPPGGEFTMVELAKAMQRDPKTVRSWHRNLGRTLRQVDGAIPEPPLLESRWDGTRSIYRFPEPIRQAILRRDMPRGEDG